MATNRKVFEKNFDEPATFRQCKAFAYACQEQEQSRTGIKDSKVYQEAFEKMRKEQKEGKLTKGECSALIDQAKNGTEKQPIPEKYFKFSTRMMDVPFLETFIDGGDWLTREEVSELCDITISKMYRLIRCKQFPPSHPRPKKSPQRGRSLMQWKIEEVEEWLKNKDNNKLKTTKPPKKPKPQSKIESIAQSITIEDDIPISPLRPAIDQLYTGLFIDLKVDQSFFVPSLPPFENRPRYVGLSSFKKAYPRRKIVQRFKVENGVKGHRYWRTK